MPGLIVKLVFFMIMVAAAYTIIGKVRQGWQMREDILPERCSFSGKSYDEYQNSIKNFVEKGDKEKAYLMFKQFRQCQKDERTFSGKNIVPLGGLTESDINKFTQDYANEIAQA